MNKPSKITTLIILAISAIILIVSLYQQKNKNEFIAKLKEEEKNINILISDFTISYRDSLSNLLVEIKPHNDTDIISLRLSILYDFLIFRLNEANILSKYNSIYAVVYSTDSVKRKKHLITPDIIKKTINNFNENRTSMIAISNHVLITMNNKQFEELYGIYPAIIELMNIEENELIIDKLIKLYIECELGRSRPLELVNIISTLIYILELEEDLFKYLKKDDILFFLNTCPINQDIINGNLVDINGSKINNTPQPLLRGE